MNQMANISAPESRMLLIQPWDKGAMKGIEKAILAFGSRFDPHQRRYSHSHCYSQLTEERRKELVKIVRKNPRMRKLRFAIIRRDLNDEIKKLEKNHEVSEDDAKNGLDDAQKLTEKSIKKLDEITAAKEKEIMEV